MTDLERQAWMHAAGELQHAAPRARGLIVEHLRARFGVSTQTVYDRLRRVGYSSGRKERSDKGTSCLTTKDLEQVAALSAAGLNKLSQPNTPTIEAHRVATDLQLPAAQVSTGHLRKLLARNHLSLADMRAPAASVAMRSLYPNHVWFFDISVSIQWFFRDERGQRLDLYPDSAARFYAGKHENYKAIRRLIYRFAAVDHYSGAYWVQYYYTSGERPEDVLDFLCGAFGPKSIGHAHPFRGLPELLVMDQGSANKSALVLNTLRSLGVKVHLHGSGNAKMSGTVESRHGHWQKTFEGRLGTDVRARDLAGLNAIAAAACADYCARRPHTRTGRTPTDLWLTIRPGQLREAPPRRVFFALAAGSPMTRTVDSYLRISLYRQEFELAGHDVRAEQKVFVRVAPFTAAGIRVHDQWGRELTVTPLTFNAAGFPENGRAITFGADEGVTMPQTPGARLAAAVKADRTIADVGDVWAALEERVQATHYVSPEGEAWAPKADDPMAAEPLQSELDCRLMARDLLGRDLSADERDWWVTEAADGLTASAFDAAFERFTAGAPAARVTA